ncbi:flagellin [Blastopirellula retiformator]|uniref:Flagellin n=1 Tax=Blastopirellula retiformator TaxID=2527970 RepID=A0A5C5VAD5_9BACT|nr:flagellin [Blastopirellula retiformator]TWT34950.1 B-type flagellin [Blastopirellula retiformator]
MTRINTNVSSLVAQKNLGRSNADLNVTLTRLSTGLRINSGKDDPAGLIASESLRSDITSVEKAITNSERANQLIATADSALGQVSSLLNDIRGLISEAANTGALSDDQIAANQLQVDSSLEAIDRIAQVTSFQGKRLLDGNLDFITQNVNSSAIEGLRIDQANFGTLDAIGVAVNVVKQATRAELNYGFGAVADNLVLEIGGANGTEAFNFARGSTIEEIASAVNLVSDATGVEAVVETAATKGTLTVSSFGADNDIILTANEAGFEPGNVRVKYTKGTTVTTTATYTAPVGNDPAKLDVTLGVSAYEASTVTIDTAGSNNAFSITTNQLGADFNGIQVILDDTGTKGAETADFDQNASTLTIHKDPTSTGAEIVASLNDATINPHVASLFTSALVEMVGPGAGGGAVAAVGAVGTFADGVDGGDIVATANDVVAAINGALGNDKVTASLAAENDGHDPVTEFSTFAYNGIPEENNELQFLAPGEAPNIRFVSNADTPLSIDTGSEPRVEGLSQSIIQNDDPNGTFSITAKLKGVESDGYAISFVDDVNLVGGGDEFVVLDRENKTIVIHAVEGTSTAQNVVDAINNDNYVSDYFEADNFGTSDGSDVLDDYTELTIPAETTGGFVSDGTLIINLETDEDGDIKTTANDLIAFFDDPSLFISDAGQAASALAYLQERGISVTNVGGSDGSGVLAPTETDIAFTTQGTEPVDAQASGATFAVNGATAQLTFTAVESGAEFDGVTVQFVNDNLVTGGVDERGEYDAASKTLTFYIEEGVTTADDIKAALDGDIDLSLLFNAVSGGTGVITRDDTATLTGGVVPGTSDGASLLGNSDLEDLGLTFRTTTFGSDSFVSVKSLSGSFGLTDQYGNTGVDRATGVDVDVRINGIQAIGDGLRASINTSSLDLSFSVGEDVEDGETFEFEIVGGGALFQLGPDVVSNQQARLGIQSVSTATLGGVSGRLFELRSGGVKSLTQDIGGAARVVDEVINVVTSLRGRLGAFQKTTLDSNIFSLNDTLANLTEAESSIRDADFAVESARLTRAQILVQSGTSVLGIANQNPQNVLSLLQQ